MPNDPSCRRHAIRRWGADSIGANPGARLGPSAQDLRYAPGLSDATTGPVWFFGIEDLADRADAGFVQMRNDWFQPAAPRSGAVRMQFHPCIQERTDEPSPHRSLVISRVARAQVAGIG